MKNAIPVCEPLLDGNEHEYVSDAIRSNWISSSGKYIDAFEAQFSQYCGARFGVACSSGTAAIHLALAALEIGAGHEVIVPSFNLIVGANAVILAGAKPVFADVHADTWCIDAASVERKVTSRTKAILAVHMYGHPCDMDELLALARRHGLYVIEDGAEAHGAECRGRRVGAIGDVGCFSFYGNKIITTGEGGMVVTNLAHIAERVALLRNQAFAEPRFVHHHIGFNYRLTNVQAAIGLAQCERIEDKLARKRQIARWYSDLLRDVGALRLPVEKPWARNVYWMYGIVLDETARMSRDELMRALAREGIETRPFFHPLHKQPVFQASRDPRFPDTDGSYPTSERLGERGLYLPSSPALTYEQAGRVAASVRSCVGATAHAQA